MNFVELRDTFDSKAVVYVKAAALLCGAFVFMLWTYYTTGKIERLVQAKKAELAAFYHMKQEYLKERASIAPFEKRLFLPHSKETPGTAIEEIGKQIGIKDNIISFKPVEEKSEKGYVQQGVEVKIDGINLNQIANLLYRTENYRNLVLVKEFLMKAHFNNPDIFDITMQVVLITKQHA